MIYFFFLLSHPYVLKLHFQNKIGREREKIIWSGSKNLLPCFIDIAVTSELSWLLFDDLPFAYDLESFIFQLIENTEPYSNLLLLFEKSRPLPQKLTLDFWKTNKVFRFSTRKTSGQTLRKTMLSSTHLFLNQKNQLQKSGKLMIDWDSHSPKTLLLKMLSSTFSDHLSDTCIKNYSQPVSAFLRSTSSYQTNFLFHPFSISQSGNISKNILKLFEEFLIFKKS